MQKKYSVMRQIYLGRRGDFQIYKLTKTVKLYKSYSVKKPTILS